MSNWLSPPDIGLGWEFSCEVVRSGARRKGGFAFILVFIDCCELPRISIQDRQSCKF